MNCRLSFISVISIISLVFVITPVWGIVIDLGVVGKTYPIVEPDIFAELKQKAAQADRSKNKKYILKQMRDYQPVDLYNLPRATVDATKMVDMTFTLDRDLVDQDGKVIYPRGYTYNPLEYVTIPGGLVVIDGDDPDQLKWFKDSPYPQNHQARLLISGGHAFVLVEKLQRPVFYLTADIAGRLQISAVPSLIFQLGNKMQIHEFKVKDED